MLHKLIGAMALSLVFVSQPAQAREIKVPIGKCERPAGSAYVERNTSEGGFRKAGANDPAAFLEAVIVRSNCLSLAADAASADYTLVLGLLNRKQFRAGKDQFGASDGGSQSQRLEDIALRALSDALSGKMVHAYVDIKDRNGQLVGRGFGRNNTSRLSYDHWTNLPAAQAANLTSYNGRDRDRLVGGALLNAYADTGVLTGQLAPIGGSTSDSSTLTKLTSGQSNGIAMTMKPGEGIFKRKSFDLVEFKRTRGTFAGSLLELDTRQTSALRRHLRKYAEWQKTAKANDIRNVEKSLGTMEFGIDRKTFSGRLLPDYVIYDVVFVTLDDGRPSLRFVKYQGGCDGPQKTDHSSCNQTGISSVSPDEAEAVLNLLDGRGDQDKSDLLR